MVNIIAKENPFSLFYVALLGATFAIPLIILTVLIYGEFGLWGALFLCYYGLRYGFHYEVVKCWRRN